MKICTEIPTFASKKKGNGFFSYNWSSVVKNKDVFNKGLVKLIKWLKIAHSILQSVSDQFHVIILSLPMEFYKWLLKNFSKLTSKNGDMGHFNL